jgi:hypothetical protein
MLISLGILQTLTKFTYVLCSDYVNKNGAILHELGCYLLVILFSKVTLCYSLTCHSV